MKKKTLLLLPLALAALSLSACGEVGPQGEQGEKGAAGEAGRDGVDGSSLLTGAGLPTNDKGRDGDSYIDTTTWDFYTKVEGTWVKVGNIKGAQGEQGETGAQGEQGEQGEKGDKGDKGDTGAQGEQGEQGEKGDKGDKGDTGAQGEKGETGAAGASLLKGSGAPSEELGKDGDSYIDTETWNFYSKENGVWTLVGCIKGADGADGHTPGDYGLFYGESTIDIGRTCLDCGEMIGDPVTSIEKPVVSTAEWEVEETNSAYKWNYDELSGVYTNGNSNIATSCAAMKLNITQSGTLVFDYTIGAEAKYDYLTVYKNSNISNWTQSMAKYNSNGYVYSTYNTHSNEQIGTGHVTLEVEAGDSLVFAKVADSSGYYNGDIVKVTFACEYTAGIVEYNTLGGSKIAPGITINGMIKSGLPVPTKEGFVFDGWYKDAECTEGNEVTAQTFIGNDVTIYAKWFDMSQQHIACGTYKGFGFKANSTSSSVNSILSNYSIEINYKGELIWNSSNTTDAFNGKFSGLDENGMGEIDGRDYYFDEEDGIIFVRKKTASSSNYFWVFVRDASDKTYTTSTVQGCVWGSYNPGYRELLKFPLAGDSFKTLYVDNVSNSFEFDPQVVSLAGPDVALKDVASTTNVGFSVYKKDGTLISNFGYDGSNMVAPKDDFFGKYTCDVANEKCTSILVSGAGKFKFWDGTKYSSISDYYFKPGTTTLYYSPGSGATEYILDVENKTFTTSNPTVNVTYNLGLHTGEFSFELEEGNVQKFAKAFDDKTGSWVYEKDLVKIVNNAATDGDFVFDGWYTDAGLTKKFAQTRLLEDTTLYAKWTPAYAVTVIPNNGEESSIIKVKEGDTPTLIEPTREGYLFAGWYTDAEFNNKYVAGAIGGALTLYAKWVEKPAWIGEYHMFECERTRYNQQCSDSVGHTLYIKDTFKITKGTTNIDFGSFNAESTLDEDNCLNTGKVKIKMATASDGRYFAAMPPYASSGLSDPMPGDLLVGCKLAAGETVSFVQTTIVANVAYLYKAIVTSGGTTTEYIVYLDCENNAMYAGCTLETVKGEDSDTTFESVYNGSYADEITIKKGDEIVGMWGLNGSSLVRCDAYGGSYTGTFNGSADTLVLDGFGNVTCGAGSGTYSVEESVATISIAGVEYKVTLTDTTFTQILDGLEGTYTGPKGELVLTGYATCTLAGVSGTYSKNGSVVKVVIGEDSYFMNLDTETNSYTAATASVLSGLEFLGNEDCNAYQYAFFIHFDEGASISGYCSFSGRKSESQIDDDYNSARFTGVYDEENCVLTITFTTAQAGSDLVGKYIKFDVDLDSGFMVTNGTNITRNSFIIDGGYYIFQE